LNILRVPLMHQSEMIHAFRAACIPEMSRTEVMHVAANLVGLYVNKKGLCEGEARMRVEKLLTGFGNRAD